MSLSQAEADDLREIVTQLFGEETIINRPTEKTLEYVETMLLEMEECSARMKKLLATLQCSAIGRGFLRRCLRGVRNLVRDKKEVFLACMVESAREWKTRIISSTI